MAASSACFVVIGAGGLGCPALLALGAAGATRVVVVDPDRVEGHNLQRQVLYDLGDVGAYKAEAAARRLPSVDVDARVHAVKPEHAAAFVAGLPAGSVVLECTDQPRLKFAINDACLAHDVPLVVGAALGWRGQAIAVRRGHACYRCIYEAPPPDDDLPGCDVAGVLGSGVGHTGMLMAHLAVRLAEPDPTVAGQLWAVDLLASRVQRLAPRANPTCPAHPPPATASAAMPA